jgi:hypothetical protein
MQHSDGHGVHSAFLLASQAMGLLFVVCTVVPIYWLVKRQVARMSRFLAMRAASQAGTVGVLELMERRSDDREIQLDACAHLLRSCAENDGVRHLLCPPGVKAILRMMQTFPQDKFIQAYGTAAIGILSSDSMDVRQRFHEKYRQDGLIFNGCESVIWSLSRFTDDVVIQNCGHQAIANLCKYNPDNVQQMVRAATVVHP